MHQILPLNVIIVELSQKEAPDTWSIASFLWSFSPLKSAMFLVTFLGKIGRLSNIAGNQKEAGGHAWDLVKISQVLMVLFSI